MINFNVKSHKIKVCFYTSVLAFENRDLFWPLIVERERLKLSFRAKMLKINKNSIFSEFLKIVKNTLALMLSIILIFDFYKESYLHNTLIWFWIIAVNHTKTSKFNKTFEFLMISSYYSYNIHNNMFSLVSHYPDFLVTSCVHVFENYIQSVVLFGLSYCDVEYRKGPYCQKLYFGLIFHITGIYS